ncbi:Ku protein [Streptomyces phytohabitans]|uniref:non-homologous end joining protein Ku n=1 Tax=Streptomyces phytohabitans TaxID=1150371 RepID=UPI00345C4C9A
MRSIWKGSISFGLVSIPVRVFSATESHSVSFRQVHTADGGRIRYRKVCELDGEEVSGGEIGKAYETADGTHVQLTDEELASLPLPTAKTVEILAFVPAEDIDPIRLDRSYYLAGDGTSADKPYVLLREALSRSGKVAVAKLALRGRESLAMLRVYEDTLTLHLMLWPDEIRSADGMAPGGGIAVRDAELDLADTLMETLGELDTEDLHDEYREAVEALVAAKEGGTVPEEGVAAPAESTGTVVDLMAVLENSVQAARQSRGEDGGAATVHELRQQGGTGAGTETGGAGKAAGKRTAAKKATGTKSTAKSPAKKAASGSAATKSASKSTGSRSGASGGAKKTAAKKSAAKKTTAKKSASTGATSKKSAAGSPARSAAKRTPRKSA